MTKLALIGTIEIAPGKKEELLAQLLAHKARCRKDEPGTLQMDVLALRDDDARLHVYEVYRDDAAFEEHHRGPSLAQFKASTAGMIGAFHITKCAVVENT
jgi:(4S)-4-hydroxy-5-phosphonooxypentane-2,3-dione isomerase